MGIGRDSASAASLRPAARLCCDCRKRRTARNNVAECRWSKRRRPPFSNKHARGVMKMAKVPPYHIDFEEHPAANVSVRPHVCP
jgi:hypothetical protein